MSLSWVIDGKIVSRFKSFIQHRTAIVISSIYLISILGLIHSSNLEYGLDDVRKKLSLLLIPMLCAGFHPLSKKEFDFLLKVFVGWALFSCVWSFCVYFGATGIEVIDKRDYSRFTSHIRFGLEIAIGTFICVYFFKQGNTKWRFLWLLAIALFLATLYVFSFMTGVVVLLVAAFVLFFVFGVLVKNTLKKVLMLSTVALIVSSSIYFVYSSVQDFYENEHNPPIKELPQTKLGNKYQKDGFTDQSQIKENGYYVERNIAWDELAYAWEERSIIPFEEKDLKGNFVKNTLIRFITSKGLRKDKDGVDQLTDKEIEAIEKGVSNYKYMEMGGFRTRMHKIIWELDAYQCGRDINGHSISMRWAYLNVTWELIKENIWFGLGTGDVKDSFKNYYKENDSVLREHYRRRGHNQYLTYAITLGIVGFLWFIVVLLYPIIGLKKYKNFLYLAFFCIITASMFTEDTLETQVGINIFAFFNTILLLKAEEE